MEGRWRWRGATGAMGVVAALVAFNGRERQERRWGRDRCWIILRKYCSLWLSAMGSEGHRRLAAECGLEGKLANEEG